jgi:hypothetical protein
MFDQSQGNFAFLLQAVCSYSASTFRSTRTHERRQYLAQCAALKQSLIARNLPCPLPGCAIDRH